MRGITEALEKIPILPDIIEELQNQISIFCFSLIAPFILPIISQVKAELETGLSILHGSFEFLNFRLNHLVANLTTNPIIPISRLY